MMFVPVPVAPVTVVAKGNGLGVEHRLLQQRAVERVDQQPPRLRRPRVRPHGIEYVNIRQERTRIEQELRVGWCDDTLKERAVPIGAHLTRAHHVRAIPDVAPIG